VSSDLSSLTEEQVLQIGRLLDTLERSSFDFLQVEIGDMKITVGKGDIPASVSAAPAATPARVHQPAPAAAPAPAPAAPAPAPAPSAPTPAAASHAGTVEITSPIMGMFYAQPEPSAPPFVTVGASVDTDTTVALVEVMKTFNAVTAGVKGQVVEVCVQNGQLVEFGQVLFRVVPE
jgi:acetyl-CoA carboxylase biotin carboxyl carrier protein